MDVAQHATRYLLTGFTVDLVGRAGSGRTQALRRVAEALVAEGRQIVRVAGVRALRGRSFSAVVENRGTRRTEPGPGQASALSTLNRDLRPGAVVLVDDADDVDSATAGALAALHVRTSAPMLLTRRPPADLSGRLRGLVTALQPGVRLELPSLRFDEVHQIVHELLGAPVEPLTVARIATKSGGLPRLVHAMVLAGTTTGTLQRVDGLWTAVGPLWSDELAHSVEALLLHTRRKDIDSLAALAADGISDLHAAQQLVPTGRLAALRRTGVIDVRSTGDGSLLSISPPLLEEYLAHTYAPRNRLSTPPLPASAPDATSGRGDAAILSRIIGDHWSSEIRARRERWALDPVPTNAVPLVRAMLVAGSSTGVDGVLARTVPGQGAPDHRAELAAWDAVRTAVSDDDLPGARQMLDRARGDAPEMTGYLDATERHLQLVLDRVPESFGLPPAGEPAGLNHESRVAVDIEIQLARGVPSAALTLLEGSGTPVHPVFRRHRLVTRGLAHVLAGELEDGTRWALQQLAEAQRDRDPGAVLAHTYVAGLGLAIAGRLDELDTLLSSALTITSIAVLQEYFHAGILALAAQTAVWQGRTDYAATLVEQTHAQRHRPGPYPQMDAGDCPAGAGAPHDDEEAWVRVRDRFERGYAAWGVFAAVDLLERAPVPVDDLRPLSGDADGPLLDALLRYAEALAERDAAGLDEAMTAFGALGAHLYAVRAAIAGAVLSRAESRPQAAARQIEHAWSLAEQHGVRADGLFEPFLQAIDLSPREVQVIGLVATGLPSSDIATALELSVRTVENYLFAVYRKVGIESREELRRATRTWLGAGGPLARSH